MPGPLNRPVVAALLAFTLSGCSVAPVARLGDRVEVSFTCRLPEGDVAASTTGDTGKGDGLKRSPIFLERGTSAPIAVTAGVPDRLPSDNLRAFEDEIVQQLRGKVVGMSEGERRTVALSTQGNPAAAAGANRVTMARVRVRPKVLRMTPADFRGRTGKDPELGQAYVVDPAVPGSVTEVGESEVVITFSATPGTVVPLSFGSGVVADAGENYEIRITAEKGRLVRSGGLVGRIAEVNDKYVILDFPDPFAGETLTCEVTLDSVQPAASVAPVSSSAAERESSAVAENKAIGEKIRLAIDESLKNGKQVVDLDADSLRDSGNVPGRQIVEAGDLTLVQYRATLDDGSLFYTTRKEEAEDPSLKKVAWFRAAARTEAEAVTAGKPSLLPGVGAAVLGMKIGEKRRVVLAPEQAFGPADPQKRRQFPLAKTMPGTVTVPAKEFVERFGSAPLVGQQVEANPYFPARVCAVREGEVDLQFLAKDGQRFPEPFGETVIRVDGNEITARLTPELGAPFAMQQESGVVAEVGAESFTVDFNNPLAGKTLTIDLEVTGLTKSAQLAAGGIPWQENHDAALAAAKKDGKPAVLVLYAEWCGFCKKLFSETMPDPRLVSLRDKFAWIRLDSDRRTELKSLYGQSGYPMIVLFKADGTLAQKLDGFQDATVLRAALQELL